MINFIIQPLSNKSYRQPGIFIQSLDILCLVFRMKINLDCYPCALRQTLQALRQTEVEESHHADILHRVMKELILLDPSLTPPEFSVRIHSLIQNESGCEDPYRNLKRISTREALSLYPELKKTIQASPDPFDTAVRLSIAGNIIDLGAAASYNLESAIAYVLKEPYAINDLELLREHTIRAHRILFLADNAGETVFDRLLIETIGKPVVYAVKEGPILNDATIEDARQAGLDQVAVIISCGARATGTVLKWCSQSFLEVFNQTELIISKGMGNFEALGNASSVLFFLLQVKCELVSKDIGVPVKSIVVKKSAGL